MRTINYESGHTERVDVAVRRAVMTGTSQVTNRISEANAELFGADGWEISAHAGARPSHAIHQGRQFPQAQYETIVKPLIDDYNCRHSAFPIIMGVTEPMYTEEQLAHIDPPPIEYEGKMYTAYEATQQQRKMERYIRKQKERCVVAEAADDKEAFTTASIRLKRQESIYKDFSEQAGLYTRSERMQVHGFGRSQAQKAVHTYKGIAKQANLWYDTGSEYGNVKAYVRDKPIRDRINSPDTIKSIRIGQQNKHIVGTKEYNDYVDRLSKIGQFGPSRLTVDMPEIESLVKQYSGTGILERDKNGKWLNNEVITLHENDIGISVNNLTGAESQTSVFKIHYSKHGTHIVPDYPSKKGVKGK